MDKIIGFSMTKGVALPNPPWLYKYPWLKVKQLTIRDWIFILWGHGDFDKFISGDQIVVGYSDIDLEVLSIDPLENRGLVIRLGEDQATIANDTLGMLPVFYASKNDIPCISTCEEVLLHVSGKVTLDPGRLVSYLIYQSTVGTLTLWKEINKLYANSILRVSADGCFEQVPQSPLGFHPTLDNVVEEMFEVTRDTVRRYTDPLGRVVLPLSSGQDSRLILCNMQRPERIKARSYPCSWPAEKSWETVISKESARLCGVNNFGILDFERDYSKWTQKAIEYYGTPVSGIQVYLYGASEMIGEEESGLPVVSGVIGDVLAGIGIGFIKDIPSPYDLFRRGCYCQDKEWKPNHLDTCLNFDWRGALEPVKSDGAKIWDNTEGDSLFVRSTLIRLRNRCSQTITYPWAALDLWGSIVPVYCDRNYVQSMLSFPVDKLRDRNCQQEMIAKYFPKIWPHSGLNLNTMDCTNTMNTETIRNGGLRSIWPLVVDGSKPVHKLFKPGGIKTIVNMALGGDTQTWFLSQSLQSIAWAVDKGYTRGI